MSTATAALAPPPQIAEPKLALQEALTGIEATGLTITEQSAQALQKPEGEEQKVNEIRKLARSIREIQEGFERVASTFVAFDDARFVDHSNNVLQLGPQWREYVERFKRSVEESRLGAVAVSTFMKEYNNALSLTNVDQSNYGFIRLSLKALIEKLNRMAEGASHTQMGFETLAKDLEDIKSAVQDTIRKAGETTHDQRWPTIMQKALEGFAVADKIDVVARFWIYFRTDIMQLKEELGLIAEPDIPISKFTMKKLAATREVARRLPILLDTYVRGIAGEF